MTSAGGALVIKIHIFLLGSAAVISRMQAKGNIACVVIDVFNDPFPQLRHSMHIGKMDKLQNLKRIIEKHGTLCRCLDQKGLHVPVQLHHRGKAFFFGQCKHTLLIGIGNILQVKLQLLIAVTDDPSGIGSDQLTKLQKRSVGLVPAYLLGDGVTFCLT